MLDAIEPLLFNRGDQLPVANNCSRRIAVVSVESEDIHGQNLIPAIKVSFTIGSNKEIAISAINADADLRAVSWFSAKLGLVLCYALNCVCQNLFLDR